VDNFSETQFITIGFTNAMRKHCDFQFNIQLEGCEDNSYTLTNTPITAANLDTLVMIE